MSFALAIAIAASFWAHHGVKTPCHPQPVPTPDAQFAAWGIAGAYAAAYPWPEACNIYLSPAGQGDRKSWPAGYCTDVVHEVGNIDGVPENTPGLTITNTYSALYTTRTCRHWRKWRHRHWGY